MTKPEFFVYAATILRLAGLVSGASLAGRLIVGFRRLHTCVERPVQVAASMAFVYSLASVYGSFTSLVLRVPPTWASAVYLGLAAGAVLGHRFLGAVYDATPVSGECS